MGSDKTVSDWIGGARAGDDESVRRLWERYFHRLAGLARKQLEDLPRLPADGEDVALSAFHSLCRGMENGRFGDLTDRDGLWRLLVTITSNKARRLKRDECRLKRGGGRATPELAALDQLPHCDPTPADAAEVADECRRLLTLLDSDELRSIALARLDGSTVEEIAAQLKKTPRTIERKLRLIRAAWSESGDRSE
ncbi:MAG: hypothetical protein K1X57_04550 [Gemmataceae bacterium]|nr:hypothetical protein [Gemmataceae bacterium]